MLDPIDSSSRQFLLGMDALNKRLDRAQQLVSSGKRIETASDSPDQIGELLQVRGEIAQNQQTQANLTSYKLEANIAANALDQASSVLDSVKSLTAVGLNGSLAPVLQANLVEQVENFMQDIVGIAATQVNGRYIFSGDSDGSAPYTLDLTQANGVSSYAGSSSTREAQHPDGSSFSIARTGQQVFDSPDAGGNVFGALANLRWALLANDSTAIQSALAGIQTAQDHVHTESVFYGMAQNRLSDATTAASGQDALLQSHLSSIQDADVTASILELQDAQFQRQATLSARAKVPPTSLFDYIRG
jgi:flagellar hook-associated protein 3 FlgL